jgi:hypothetical protein
MKNITSNDFEQVEADIEETCRLMGSKNYPGLVDLCRERLARDPDDGHAVEALAEAFVLNNQGQDSIEMLTPYYLKDPTHYLYTHAILDALFSMGKTVHDFPWKSEPVILELTTDVLEKYYQYLKPKRKPRSVTDLFYTHIGEGYLHFTDEDLLQALMGDERFSVTCDNTWESGVSILRKQQRQ